MRDHATYDAPVYDDGDGLNAARGMLLALGVMLPTLAAVALLLWWMLR